MSKTTHARRITAMILAAAMIIGMTPTIAFAADAQELISTPMGAGALKGIIKDTNEKNPDHPSGNYYESGYIIAYYGDNGDGKPMPWYVLDNNYETGSGNGTGILLQTQHVYNYGTQWNGYATKANWANYDAAINAGENHKTRGYWASDIRKYLSGKGTYTSLRTLYSPVAENRLEGDINGPSHQSYYFALRKVEDSEPVNGKNYYYIADTSASNADFVEMTDAVFKNGGLTFSAFAQTYWYPNYLYTRNEGIGKFELDTESSYSDQKTYYVYTGEYSRFDDVRP